MVERSSKEAELSLSEQLSILIDQQFRDLGDFMGDLLLLLELQTVANKKPQDIPQIRSLIDRYSEKGDEILNQHRLGLTSDIDKLVSLLVLDLQKLSSKTTNTENIKKKKLQSFVIGQKLPV